jgi:DNA helicase-2/ATP-dependent DNA helicase PcrA
MEFDTVFLSGASDGILPDLSHDTTNLAEENRLAYVAVTRAMERLYVTYTSSNNGKNVEASRFFSQQFQNV